MATNQAARIKIKASQTSIGLGVFFDGQQVGRIIGSRDPNGKHHAGYYLELTNGKQYGYNGSTARKSGAYSYADDIRREIKGWIGREIIEQFGNSASH